MTLTAQPLKLELHQFGVRGPTEFEGAFAAMAAKRVDALAVLDDAILIANAPAIAKLALQQRLPSIGWPDYALAGGLMAYGVNFPDMFRRCRRHTVPSGPWHLCNRQPKSSAGRIRFTNLALFRVSVEKFCGG